MTILSSSDLSYFCGVRSMARRFKRAARERHRLESGAEGQREEGVGGVSVTGCPAQRRAPLRQNELWLPRGGCSSFQ